MELRFFKRKTQVKKEIDCIHQLLLQGSSFKSFCTNNEVFDICKHKVIKKGDNLFQLYAHGNNIGSIVFIINKN